MLSRAHGTIANVHTRVYTRVFTRARSITSSRAMELRCKDDGIEPTGFWSSSEEDEAPSTSASTTPILSKAEKKRRARFASIPIDCPACGQEIKSNAFRMHLQKCASDVLRDIPKSTWNVDDINGSALEARRIAGEINDEFVSKVKTMCYRHRDGLKTERVTTAQAAEALGVPEDRVKMTLRRASLAIELAQEDIPLDVVFEDDEFLVVNKPPNLRFHPNHRFESNSLLSRALHHLGGATPYIVHRLDMDTSGVAVFVKKHSLVSDIAAQFQNKTAKKTYLAISVGVSPPGCGDAFVVEAPIGDHGIVREARTVDFSGEGKEARTICEIATRADTTLFDITDESVAAMTTPKGVTPVGEPTTESPKSIAALVRVLPLTGRTHQIRVHLAHAGLPIVSDALYGPHLRWSAQSDEEKAKHVWSAEQLAACASENPTQMHQLTPPDSRDAKEPWGQWGGALSIRRQALHAHRLELKHPVTGETLMFQAPMPDDMRIVCDALSLDTSAF